MPANGRNPFTREDDALLIKYIAKYNPGVKGRSGNKIYQLLVQNEHKRWNWSSRHPWSGWRDRYMKNQADFNGRIKKYQIKKGLPTENVPYIPTLKLKGSDVEESDAEEAAREESKRKRKRESSADARKRVKEAKRHKAEGSGVREVESEANEHDEISATEPDSDVAPEPAPAAPRRRTHVPDIYPDIAVLDDSPEPRDTHPKRSTHKPVTTRPAPKLRAALHDPDSNFFASVPPTPTTTTDPPSRPPTTAREAPPSPKPKPRGLPKLVEGTFRTFFAGVRNWTGGGDAKSSDDDSPQKQWPPARVRKERSKNSSTEKAGDDMEIEQGDVARKEKSVTGSRNAPSEKVGHDTESENDRKEKSVSAVPPAPPARRPPSQVNAVASSSRVQLPASSRAPSIAHASPGLHSQRGQRSPSPQSLHQERSVAHAPSEADFEQNQTPPHQRSQSLQRSSRRQSLLQSPNRHNTQRSPSPLDWGSPVEKEKGNASSPVTSRTLASPSKTQTPPDPSPLPFDSIARTDRYNLSRQVGSSPRDNSSRVLPRLSFAETDGSNSGHSGTSSLRNRDRSIGNVERGSLSRRSRATSPPTDAHRTQYRLPSPPRAGSSRPQSGTPLATKSKRRAQDALPFGFKPITQHPADEPRRHSFPAAAFRRVDFDSMRSSTAPRQSLPPRPPPSRAPQSTRRHSLFSPRAPPPASTSVSPQFSVSANDRPLIEQLGLQTLMAMAQHHGFTIEVVRNLFARTGSLPKTEEILLRMRKKAEEEGEALLRGEDEAPPESPQESFELPHRPRHSGATTTRSPREESTEIRHRRRQSGANTKTTTRSPPEPPEEPFELRHRRQDSGATATTAQRSPPSAPSSSQRKKRRQEDEFHPQPLVRDVLADTEYTPPSGSRAGALARAMKKGRVEEGLQREQQRASGGGTLSSFSRDARLQTQGRGRPDMEDDVPPTPMPQFAAFAEGNVQVLRELERRDVSLAMLRTADVARYMVSGTLPSPYP
ncbi:hypothetical protein B0H13DRAFT_2272119 [Mycena leptocephala]|nr:hypothetical protein B0H13DRAFT_2272119 [Mycena leptocephala]